MLRIEINRNVLGWLAVMLLLVNGFVADAGNSTTPSKPYTFAAGGTIRSSEINANYDTLYSELQGNIGTANLLDACIATAKLIDLAVTEGKLAAAVTVKLAPTGAISAWSTATAPTGWLLCRGQAISRTTYAALFAVVGTTYGVGDGSTTFNIPDITGRVIAGQEAVATRLTAGGSGITGSTLGAAGGAQTVALTEANLAAHTHSASQGSHNHTQDAHGHGITDTHVHSYQFPGATGVTVGGTSVNAGAGAGTNTGTAAGGTSIVVNNATATNQAASAGAITIGSTGGTTAHNVTQPTIILNWIIKD